MEEYDTAINVVFCDTKIQGRQVFGRADLPLKLSPICGGGADFRHVFESVATEPAPYCLIYFTDLECNRFPDNAPDYPVVWVKTGDAGRSSQSYFCSRLLPDVYQLRGHKVSIIAGRNVFQGKAFSNTLENGY